MVKQVKEQLYHCQKCTLLFHSKITEPEQKSTAVLSFLEAVFFSLVEEVRLGGAQVDDLGAAVPVLLLDGALLAVVGVGDARPAADHATTLDEIQSTITRLSY